MGANYGSPSNPNHAIEVHSDDSLEMNNNTKVYGLFMSGNGLEKSLGSMKI